MTELDKSKYKAKSKPDILRISGCVAGYPASVSLSLEKYNIIIIRSNEKIK